MNPSLLLLATSTAEVDSEDDGKMPPVVTIYLIDSVVGRIISRTRHVNAMGPIHGEWRTTSYPSRQCTSLSLPFCATNTFRVSFSALSVVGF